MDISNNLLIDLLLNLAGFIVAGALFLTIYSIFKHRKKPKISSSKKTLEVNLEADEKPAVRKSFQTGAGEFIRFSEKHELDGKPNNSNGQYRRTLSIQKAREMIKEGAADAEIRSAVPVSEAELAVLKFEHK
ncbi:MAG: hypothetical protein U9N55_09270 [candidate division Zixibacteria bacterium]|nr:hypothetical protein [candidate division Zixibacteria bacterium]